MLRKMTVEFTEHADKITFVIMNAESGHLVVDRFNLCRCPEGWNNGFRGTTTGSSVTTLATPAAHGAAATASRSRNAAGASPRRRRVGRGRRLRPGRPVRRLGHRSRESTAGSTGPDFG